MAIIRRFLAEAADVTPVQIPAPPAIIPPPPQIQVAAVDPVHMQAASPTPAPAAAAEDEEVDVTGVVDADGLPWDPRIHSSSKQLVADGTWRKRRNTAKELFAEVEAELRGLSTVDAQSTLRSRLRSRLRRRRPRRQRSRSPIPLRRRPLPRTTSSTSSSGA